VFWNVVQHGLVCLMYYIKKSIKDTVTPFRLPRSSTNVLPMITTSEYSYVASPVFFINAQSTLGRSLWGIFFCHYSISRELQGSSDHCRTCFVFYISFSKDLPKNNNIGWLKTVFSTILMSHYNYSFNATIMASKNSWTRYHFSDNFRVITSYS